MKRILLRLMKYFGAASLLVAVMLCFIIYYLLFTTSGLRTLIDEANGFLDGSVKITADIRNGSVMKGFNSRKPLVVDIPGVVCVRARRINIKYDILAYLVKDYIPISLIDADKLEVELYPSVDEVPSDDQSADSDDDKELRIKFPVKIGIDRLKLKDFAYLSDIIDVRVKNAMLVLEAKDEKAILKHGHADDVSVHLKYESEEDDSPDINVAGFDDGNGAIEKLFSVDLPLDVQMDNFCINRGRYYMDGYDTGIIYASVDASWNHTLLTVKSVRASHNLGSVSVSGTMKFENFYDMDFNIIGQGHQNEYTYENYDGALFELGGEGHLKGDLVDLSLDASIKSPSQIDFYARINSLSSLLPFEFKVKSENVTYPFNTLAYVANKAVIDNGSIGAVLDRIGTTQLAIDPGVSKDDLKSNRIRLKDTSLDVSGHIMDTLKVDLSTVLSGRGFDSLKINLDALSSLEKTTVNSLTANGKLTSVKFQSHADGIIDYTDGFSFDGNIDVAADDAAGLHQTLKGPLFLDSSISANITPEHSEVTIDNLEGQFYLLGEKSSVNVQDLKASTDADVSLQSISYDSASASVSILSDGVENSSFSGKFEIRNLSHFVPESEGSLVGNIKLDGKLKEPFINLIANVPKVRYKGYEASNVVLNSRFDLKTLIFNNVIIAQKIGIDAIHRTYRSCSLDIRGSLQEHDINLFCGLNSNSFAIIHGGYDLKTKDYKGELNRFHFISNIIEPVNLESPVSFSFNTESLNASASEIYISDGTAKVHTGKSVFENGVFTGSFDVKDYNLKNLIKFFPDLKKISGSLSGGAKIKYQGGVFFLEGEAVAKKGVFEYQGMVLPYKQAKVSVINDSNSINMKFGLDLVKDLGNVTADISILNPKGNRALSGKLKVSDLDLGLFVHASSAVNSLQGTANLDGSLGGTLEKPLFYGKLNAKGDGNPTYNIGYFDDFNLTLSADGDHGIIDGKITLNNSPIDVNGSLNWSESTPCGSISLDAKELPVFLMGKGEAYADVHADAAFAEGFSLKGSVDVTHGLIKFNSSDASLNSRSADEIFVDENSNLYSTVKTIVQNSNPVPYEMSLKVNLGNNLKVDSMGVKGRLEGSVDISKSLAKDKIVSDGTVSLVDGKANLYGHKFLVNHAVSTFAGAVDNPKLDAEVICDPSYVEDDVIAGVKITGRAQSPDIRLFSNPAMSQNEILSYVLYGHGLEKNSTQNTQNSQAQLLMLVGISTASGFLNRVANVMGMDSLQVGSSGTGNDTQVEVQSYITNRIRLSYGFGVFNSVHEFKLRYEIMKKLYVEYASSIEQSIDLIYSFESD